MAEKYQRRISIKFVLFLCVSWYVCLLLASCQRPVPAPDGTAIIPNDKTCFPCVSYTEIQACKVTPTGARTHCAALMPAHKADLFVALALPAQGYFAHSNDCFQAEYSIRYMDADTCVGEIRWSRTCRSAQFWPWSRHVLGPEGQARMELIFEEMQLLDEN